MIKIHSGRDGRLPQVGAGRDFDFDFSFTNFTVGILNSALASFRERACSVEWPKGLNGPIKCTRSGAPREGRGRALRIVEFASQQADFSAAHGSCRRQVDDNTDHHWQQYFGKPARQSVWQ